MYFATMISVTHWSIKLGHARLTLSTNVCIGPNKKALSQQYPNSSTIENKVHELSRLFSISSSVTDKWNPYHLCVHGLSKFLALWARLKYNIFTGSQIFRPEHSSFLVLVQAPIQPCCMEITSSVPHRQQGNGPRFMSQSATHAMPCFCPGEYHTSWISQWLGNISLTAGNNGW